MKEFEAPLRAEAMMDQFAQGAQEMRQSIEDIEGRIENALEEQSRFEARLQDAEEFLQWARKYEPTQVKYGEANYRYIRQAVDGLADFIKELEDLKEERDEKAGRLEERRDWESEKLKPLHQPPKYPN